MAINILDSMIINRISAGEVVESPFSIVKELIDNSIDAGATKISIEILNGGIDSIIIKDNGKGIEKDDLIKAFLPHATSKISSLLDLDAIKTLGFRGEAIASISNVSNTTIISKRADSDCAYSLRVDGGSFGVIEPTARENGTTVIVENLFFNTPVRRKFLKKPKQEENQITNVIARYILANPSISFKYSANNTIIYQNHGSSLKDAIYCVYGLDTTQNILEVNKTLGNITLSGYSSKIGFSKPNTTYQTLIVNNRYVEDETVSKAVYMAYEEYLMSRQFPFYVLNLNMPAEDVDVNVHPNKMNIKFSNPSKIYDLVYSAIRSAIFISENPKEEQTSIIQPTDNLIKVDLNSLKEIEIDTNKTLPNLTTNIKLKQENFSPITIFDSAEDEFIVENNQNTSKNIEIENLLSNLQIENTDKIKNNDYIDVKSLSKYKIVGEIFNEFIILEKDDNMLLLDFHAGHERLNYDKFVKMVNDKDVVIQDLLIPYTQEMSVQEVEYIMSLSSELKSLGFDIETFGDTKIIINAIPLQLKDINLKNFINDLLHDMKNLKPKLNYELTNFLMQKACKSSVKSGQKLSEFEIMELLKDLDIKKPVLLCPHGRPILTVVNKSQIEKWFKRIV